MWYVILVGLVAMAFGFAFIFLPDKLRKIDEMGIRLVSDFDSIAFSYRIGFGIALIIAGIFLFYAAYYIKTHG